MILEWIIEAVSGARLDALFYQRFSLPLGIDDLFFVEHLAGPRRIAPYAVTERCPWRGKVLRGEVHDDNAWAVGGVAGHAGLFGTASAVGTLLVALLSAWRGESPCEPFSPGMVRRFLRRDRVSGRALGFDIPASRESSAGRFFSSGSVGHLGFTGTSFWMDLRKGIIIVLLTNRVYPTRDNIGIRNFRPFLHDTVMRALLSEAA